MMHERTALMKSSVIINVFQNAKVYYVVKALLFNIKGFLQVEFDQIFSLFIIIGIGDTEKLSIAYELSVAGRIRI